MSSTAKTLICRYRYDPLDRLISQAPLESPSHQRFYCKSRLATEICGALGFSIIQHNDQLLAQQQHEGNAVETLLLGTDQQRSVLTRLKADHSPTSTAYSPYGHHPALGAVSDLLAFNGERPDPVTGHYLLGNGYRAFNPVLLRFNSPDNLSPFGKGGLNSYSYCLGDPINLSDPQGHAPIVQTLRAMAPKHIMLATIKKTKNTLSNLPTQRLPKAKLKTHLKTEIAETNNVKTLLDESSLLEINGIQSGDITPLKLTDSKSITANRYLAHQQSGIPFDDSGIPSPNNAITTINSQGREVLRTDFFDNAISLFHLNSTGTGSQHFKTVMSESTGKTIINRALYIRKYALRNYNP
jgi:RHS repeat-associated protein